MRRTTLVVLVITGSLLAAGCSLSRKEEGALLGAGVGAAAGGVVGNATGSTVRGTIVGAVVGGAAGGVIGHQMDQQAKELSYELPGATVTRVAEGITVTFPDGLLFEFGSDVIGVPARENLTKFAASLKKYPRTNSLIVGHTDSRGPAKYNIDLSERRARSAVDFLSGQGIDRVRLHTAGRGSNEPIATNGTDAGRQLNRRVEVAIYADEAFRRQGQLEQPTGLHTLAGLTRPAVLAVMAAPANAPPRVEIVPLQMPAITWPVFKTVSDAVADQRRHEADRMRNVLREKVLFSYGKSELNENAMRTLDAKVVILNTNPAVRLMIEGYADERGTAVYNEALGLRRANALRDYLSAAGLLATRLDVISYGNTRPLSAGTSDADHAQNRRGEFLVLGELLASRWQR
jgi:outer membrane protein OmpA-like peptidoglycan-associated protein